MTRSNGVLYECDWRFDVKTDENGNVIQLKARLVGRGPVVTSTPELNAMIPMVADVVRLGAWTAETDRDPAHYVLIGDGKKENKYKYSLTSWYITRQLYPRQSPPPPPPPPPQHHYQLAGRQTLRRSGHRLSGIPILCTRHPS